MSEDYLWDRSGTPDPDIARLESLLGRYAHRSAGAPPAVTPAPRRLAGQWPAKRPAGRRHHNRGTA